MKTTLYLGTDPSHFASQGYVQGNLIHYPVIKIIPRSLEHPELVLAYADLEKYTHIIFTSKNAVAVFFEHHTHKQVLDNTKIIAIGAVTAAHLKKREVHVNYTSEIESQEGLIFLLNRMHLDQAYFFLPRSSLARPELTEFFQEKKIRFLAADLYDTVTQKTEPIPDLEQIDEIVFTSPSTVDAFIEIFGSLPKNKRLISIGPITEQSIQKHYSTIEGALSNV